MTLLAPASSAMADEIAQQGDILRRLVAARDEVHDVVFRVAPRDLRGVALLGRGSSANALLFGRYAFEVATRHPATFVAPSLHAIYGTDVDYDGFLVVAASQSGRTPEIVEGLARLTLAGVPTIALTADTSSPLAQVATVALDLRTGRERAVPATKTFTAELAVVAMVAEALGPVPWRDEHWPAVAGAIEEVVADPAAAWRAASRLGHLGRAARVVVVGRGFFLAVAHEAALKLQESALIAATAHSAASFRHGPVVATGADFPVLAIVGSGPSCDDVDDLVATLRHRGVAVMTIGARDDDLPLPAALPDALLVLPAAVRAQQLALALATQLGLDPDAPPGLEKVTRT